MSEQGAPRFGLPVAGLLIVSIVYIVYAWDRIVFSVELVEISKSFRSVSVFRRREHDRCKPAKGSAARSLQEADLRMKPIPKVGKVLLGVVILFAFYPLNRGVLIGSTVEIEGHVSGTTQPIYRPTCRYLSLNGIKQRIWPPQLSEDFRCSLFN